MPHARHSPLITLIPANSRHSPPSLTYPHHAEPLFPCRPSPRSLSSLPPRSGAHTAALATATSDIRLPWCTPLHLTPLCSHAPTRARTLRQPRPAPPDSPRSQCCPPAMAAADRAHCCAPAPRRCLNTIARRCSRVAFSSVPCFRSLQHRADCPAQPTRLLLLRCCPGLLRASECTRMPCYLYAGA